MMKGCWNKLMYISYNEHYKEGVDVVLSINPIRHIAVISGF